MRSSSARCTKWRPSTRRTQRFRRLHIDTLWSHKFSFFAKSDRIAVCGRKPRSAVEALKPPGDNMHPNPLWHDEESTTSTCWPAAVITNCGGWVSVLSTFVFEAVKQRPISLSHSTHIFPSSNVACANVKILAAKRKSSKCGSLSSNECPGDQCCDATSA